MKTPDSNLMVCVGDKDVWVKVLGRANFNCSVDFKTLVTSLWQKGYTCFRLDLTGCLLMDSTFLGVLSGLGIKLHTEKNGTSPTIYLVNPNERISDLLENLGVTHLFQIAKGAAVPDHPYTEQKPSNASPEAMLQTSLEAHDDLGTVNPDNIQKFKDVRRFLDEDLKRLRDKKNQDDPPPAPPAPSAT